MKKFFITAILCLCSLFLVCSCANTQKQIQPAPEQSVIDQIKSAYYNKYQDEFVTEYYAYGASDISIRYYGEYNGTHVMFIDVPFFDYTCAIEKQTIDGVTIIYCDGQKLVTYYDGNFYSLQTAFDNGYLTHNDIVKIKNLHRDNNHYLY